MGTTIPPVFKHKLPQTTCFSIQRKEWNELLRAEKGKLHPKWSDLMDKSLKESNPYCAFAFKRHWIKNHLERSQICILKHMLIARSASAI